MNLALETTCNSSLSTLLKQVTQAQHSQVEAVFSQHLFNPALTPEQYSAIITMLQSIYGVLEPIFMSQLETRALQRNRNRLALINQDLDHLPETNKIPLTGISTFVNFTKSLPGFALGAMYVTEGSTMGGKVIASELRKLPWVDETAHLNFFANSQCSTADMWRQVVQYLNQYGLENPANEATVLKGAASTFALFEQSIAAYLQR